MELNIGDHVNGCNNYNRIYIAKFIMVMEC